MFKELKEDIKLIIFCIVIGAAGGVEIWIFLKLMMLGREFIWSFIPSIIKVPLYTVIICFGGGLLIGNIHKKYGEFPEDMNDVLNKLKSNREFEYRNLPLLAISALLPLIIGSCVGPEAGLAGLVVTIWSWTSVHLKSNYRSDKDFSKLGIAVTLSVLFQAPLFGVFVIEEESKIGDEHSENKGVLKGKSKYILYAAAIGAGAIVYMLFSKMFGTTGAGLIVFKDVNLTLGDYVIMVLYILCGCIMAVFYYITKSITLIIRKIPVMVREGIGGLVLGTVCTITPLMMFCSSTEVSFLVKNYGNYAPEILVAAALIKVLMANFCRDSGLNGGHFLPLIYSGICLGSGIATLFFGAGDHTVLASAIVCAALLGGVIKKPLAVTMLLAVCFPVKILIWIFLSATVGERIIRLIQRKE